jgi:hypothetical protein
MATIIEGMTWFKQAFRAQIVPAIAGTPFTLSFLTAIATQETFEVWGNIFKSQPAAKVLEVCVGDTIDGPSRTAFPTSKTNLLSVPGGDKLFAVARAALEEVGLFNATYHKIAVANPDKFCHGFGIFQYDLQFSKTKDRPFFLDRKWLDFGECLTRCLAELTAARKKAKLGQLPVLTDLQLAYVAIAYNCGSFDPKRGLKQGFRDKDTGKYYGEYIADYIAMANHIA